MAKKVNASIRLAPYVRRSKSGEDPAVLDIAYRMCGDREVTVKLAKAFLSLRQTYPHMTLPEYIFYAYLQKRQERFVFQDEVAQGRVYHGGSVVDFFLPSQGYIVRVQGDYWHTLPGKEQEDEVQRQRLLTSTIQGVRVRSVIDLWESRLLDCGRDGACDAALNGVELGRI